jgi:hypothetical protein
MQTVGRLAEAAELGDMDQGTQLGQLHERYNIIIADHTKEPTI